MQPAGLCDRGRKEEMNRKTTKKWRKTASCTKDSVPVDLRQKGKTSNKLKERKTPESEGFVGKAGAALLGPKVGDMPSGKKSLNVSKNHLGQRG